MHNHDFVISGHNMLTKSDKNDLNFAIDGHHVLAVLKDDMCRPIPAFTVNR